ncbi:MAG: nitroreductase family deazaflavin-dependent oxidoreductase [Anaerolineales bacterium]|jgi:deazaflavin-dependent oxidoreductase (nitroreductase family)
MSKSIVDKPPGKALRFGLRLPIWLYRAHLGWLLGDRFLMLTHTGRKSGLERHTVIEVVQHNKDADTYYVVSGWGEKSDWYQNIRKKPSVTIQTGGRQFKSTAEFIPVEKAIGILQTYAREHPTAFNELSGLFLGERMKPGSDAPQRIAEKMPMVAFRPENGS